MESQSTEGASAELQAVTRVLHSALEEACGAEITRADTGELLRVEQALAVASEAARKVVDIRRGRQRGRTASKRPPGRGAGPATDPAGLEVANRPHRVFVDGAGVKWDAFAVYPSAHGTGRARLPMSYQNGWLSFDSGTERRRLGPIPEGWHAMPDEALSAVCARAEPAPQRLPHRDGESRTR